MCHRSVLKYRAKYLYNLISHDNNQHTLLLNTLDKESLMALLRYVYAAQLHLQGLSLE